MTSLSHCYRLCYIHPTHILINIDLALDLHNSEESEAQLRGHLKETLLDHPT